MSSLDLVNKFLVITTVLAISTACALDAAHGTPQSVEARPFTNTAQDRYADIAGNTIHYQKAGQGPPIILIHGFGAWSFTWRENIEYLSGHYTVYAIDLLGFGLSDKPKEGPYSVASQAGLIIGFMDAMGLAQAVLIGNSLGGEIALSAALARPERIEALVLIDSSGFLDTPWIPRWLNPSVLKTILTVIATSRLQVEYSLENAYYNDKQIDAHTIDGYQLPTTTHDVPDALLGMSRQLKLGKERGRFHLVTQPTLILWGMDDEIIPVQHAFKFQRTLTDSKLVIIPEAGHVPHEEKPTIVNKLIHDFIDKARSGHEDPNGFKTISGSQGRIGVATQ